MTRKIIGLTALALLLAACGDGDESVVQESGEDTGPQGEVRGGTISDAMLPIAMVQSQSPQSVDREDDSDGDGGGDESDDGNDSEESDDAE